MPQRFVDSGRIVPMRAYQSITTAGDLLEGPITLPEAETNILEIVCQSWRQVFIEGRNEGADNTVTQKVYGTRKFIDSVPPQGDAFWTVTGNHWEVVDTQAAIAVTTNATPVVLVDKGYTYLVVTGDGPTGAFSSGTVDLASVIAGDILTVNGLTYTAVAGAKANDTEFSIDGTDTADATDLADSITNDVRAGITTSLDVTATSSVAQVTIVCTTKDDVGNTIDLSEDTGGTTLIVSGAFLSGGIDDTSAYIARAVLTA